MASNECEKGAGEGMNLAAELSSRFGRKVELLLIPCLEKPGWKTVKVKIDGTVVASLDYDISPRLVSDIISAVETACQ